MRIPQAIRRISSFVKKGENIYFDKDGWIWAPTPTFTVGVRADVAHDEVFPQSQADGKMLAGLIKGAKEVSFPYGDHLKGGIHILKTDKGSTYQMHEQPAVPRFLVPDAQLFKPIPDWKLIQQVFHAASDGKDLIRAPLQNIRFGQSCFVASNEAQIAKAFLDEKAFSLQNVKAYFPASAFSKWPKNKPVAGFIDNTTGWFSIEDEIRSIPRRNEGLQKTHEMSALRGYPGCTVHMQVSTKLLVDAIKAFPPKENKTIHLSYSAKALQFSGSFKESVGTYPVPHMSMAADFCKLNAHFDRKLLEATLKSLTSKEIYLLWNGKEGPLTGLYHNPCKVFPLRFASATVLPSFFVDLYPLVEM